MINEDERDKTPEYPGAVLAQVVPWLYRTDSVVFGNSTILRLGVGTTPFAHCERMGAYRMASLYSQVMKKTLSLYVPRTPIHMKNCAYEDINASKTGLTPQKSYADQVARISLCSRTTTPSDVLTEEGREIMRLQQQELESGKAPEGASNYTRMMQGYARGSETEFTRVPPTHVSIAAPGQEFDTPESESDGFSDSEPEGDGPPTGSPPPQDTALEERDPCVAKRLWAYVTDVETTRELEEYFLPRLREASGWKTWVILVLLLAVMLIRVFEAGTGIPSSSLFR
jgi:hypothetical protein